jgi:hypothetical protein
MTRDRDSLRIMIGTVEILIVSRDREVTGFSIKDVKPEHRAKIGHIEIGLNISRWSAERMQAVTASGYVELNPDDARRFVDILTKQIQP